MIVRRSQVGDRIEWMGGESAAALTHERAIEMILQCGDTLEVSVSRPCAAAGCPAAAAHTASRRIGATDDESAL